MTKTAAALALTTALFISACVIPENQMNETFELYALTSKSLNRVEAGNEISHELRLAFSRLQAAISLSGPLDSNHRPGSAFQIEQGAIAR